jgi:hypothetical protein
MAQHPFGKDPKYDSSGFFRAEFIDRDLVATEGARLRNAIHPEYRGRIVARQIARIEDDTIVHGDLVRRMPSRRQAQALRQARRATRQARTPSLVRELRNAAK